MRRYRRSQLVVSSCLFTIFAVAVPVSAQTATPEAKKPDFPKVSDVTKDFTEVKPQDGTTSFYRLWKKDKDGSMLAELPKDFASTKSRHFIAPTVSGGEQFAGLQSDAFYVYWKKFGKRVALIAENLSIKGSDDESKSSVKRIFTDRVLLSVPILAMDKGKGPVIDLDNLLVGNARVFLGSDYRPQASLIAIKKSESVSEKYRSRF